MQNFLPTVSVVIPTLNEERALPTLLEDLCKQSFKPLEIIVVDGHSDDETLSLARQYRQVKTYLHRRGVGHQRRFGGFLAKGDYIFFLDADVKLSSDFIERVVSKMQSRNLHLACPWYIPKPGSFFIHLAYAGFNSIFFLGQKIVPSGAGSCIVVRRSTYLQTYGFDHRFKFDDIEYIRRVSRSARFGIVAKQIGVSDRRFREHGVLKMTLLYSVMSIFFLLGWFWPTNFVKYEFGKYKRGYGKVN